MSELNWAKPFLGDVAEVIDPHPSHRAPQEVEGGVPFVGIGDLTTSGEVLASSARKVSPRVLDEHRTRYSVAAGDIAYGRVATVGKVMRFGEITEQFALSPTMALIKPIGVSASYLAHFLQSKQWDDESAKLLTGTTRSSLGIQLLRKIRISCPRTLEEQRAIGRILDTLDTAIHETEAIIAKLKAVKRGLLHDLMTRGIDANGELRPPPSDAPQRYKESRLGWIPLEWNVRRLDEYCVSVADGTHDSPKPSESGYPLITSKNLRGGRLDLTDSYLIGEADYRAVRARSAVEVGDLLFGMIGTVGSPVIIGAGQDQIATKNVGLLRVGGNSSRGRFLKEWLESAAVEKQLSEAMSGSTQRFIGLGTLRSLLALEPDANEIVRIVDVSERTAARIEAELSFLGKLEVLKSGLTDDLLSGRVRVTPLLEQTERAKECA